MKKRQSIIIVFIFFFALMARSQQRNFPFTQLSQKHGLSSQSVSSILRDSLGYMWFGTSDGLNRYDGYEFVTYRNNPFDSTSVSGNIISCLFLDSKGNIWIGTSGQGLNKFNPLTNRFTRYLNNPSNPKSLPHNIVTDVIEYNDSTIFIGTYDGISVLHVGTHDIFTFRHDENDPNSIGKNGAMDLFIDNHGTLYISTWASGINVFNEDKNNFIRYTKKTTNLKNFDNYGSRLYVDENGIIWFGTIQNGLFKYNPKENNVSHICPEKIKGSMIRSLVFDGNNKLWVGTQNQGLFRIDTASLSSINFTPSATDNYSISDRSILSLYNDIHKTLWIGTSNQGLNKIDNNLNFSNYYQIERFDGAGNDDFKTIIDGGDDIIWIRTESAGIIKYNLSSKQFHRYLYEDSPDKFFLDSVPNKIFVDNDSTIWTRIKKQYYSYSEKDDKFIKDQFFPVKINLSEYHNLRYWLLPNNDIWLLKNFKSLLYWNNKTEKLTDYTEYFINKTGLETYLISFILEDSDSFTWLSTNKSLCRINFSMDSVCMYSYNPQDIYSISDNRTSFIYEDSKKRIWIATRNGLNYFDRNSGKFIRYTKSDGLQGNIIERLIEDNNSAIWLMTENGLSVLDPVKQKFRNFKVHQYRDIFYGIFSRRKSGEMIIGGGNNFLIFHPDSLSVNQNKPQPIINKFFLFQEEVKPESNAILQKNISYTDKITLTHKQSTFGFEFIHPDYTLSSENRFAYKLDGFEQKWNYTTSANRRATYRNIPGGEYTFIVEAANNDGIWCDYPASIHITILKPWWRTWWFYSVIVSFAGILLILFYRIRILQVKRRNIELERLVEERTYEIEQSKEELSNQADKLKETNQLLRLRQEKIENQSEELKQQAQELSKVNDDLIQTNATKNKLFSIIAHDLRNPFHSILSYSGILLKKIDALTPEQLNSHIKSVYKSAQQAYILLEDLLEWALTQRNMITFRPEVCSAPTLINDTILLIEGAATEKEVIIKTNLNEAISLFVDKKMVQTILRNILSNSIKFSHPGGIVSVKAIVESEFAKVSICDDGLGMDEGTLNNLFKPGKDNVRKGTRGEQGTGLGLIVTKEFVDRNKGKISITSQLGRGTCFHIYLPVTEQKVQVTEKEKPQSEKGDQKPQENQASLPGKAIIDSMILIVEDNIDIRKNIVDCLSGYNNLLQAENGLQALEIVDSTLPDIIISDIMMPEMDGYELCKRIKLNEETCHIPFIMLTAKVADSSQLKGLESGADDYLHKPFHPEILTLKVKNLLQSRHELRKKFAHNTSLNPQEFSSSPLDKSFLEKAFHIVEQNLSNPDFNSNMFIHEMGMSRTRLFVKLKALTDQSATEFIRNIRLKKAAGLLLKEDLTISEIAYKVGFNNRTYFSKSFSELFGMSPSDYISKHTS